MSAKRTNKTDSMKPTKIFRSDENIVAELKKMIKVFNCNELIALMQFAQKPKTGKKAELMDRALNLVNNGCEMPIQIKIKSIYNQHLAHLRDLRIKSSQEFYKTNKEGSKVTARMPSKKRKSNIILSDTSSNSSSSPSWSPENNDSTDSFSSYSSYASHYSNVVDASQNSNHNHIKIKVKTLPVIPTSVVEARQSSVPSSSILPKNPFSNFAPNHPIPSQPLDLHINNSTANNQVKMLSLPFYDHISTIIHPTMLTKYYAIGSSTHTFFLSPNDIKSIENSKIWHTDGMMEYEMQVLMRFGIHNSQTEQDDFFPPRISVTVNNKQPTLPALIPVTKIGVDPKRPNVPVNITQLLRLSPTEKNVIIVRWEDTSVAQSYVISVVMTKRLTSSILLQRKKKKVPTATLR